MAQNGGAGQRQQGGGQKQGQGRQGQQKQGAPKQPKSGRNEYAYLELPGNKQLHEETTAATNVAYKPVERQTKENLRASAQRTKNLGAWWNEYLAQVAGTQAETNAAYANAAATTQGLINTGSAVDTANTAKLNTEQSAAAAARGQSADAANAATTGTANSALSQRNTQLGTMGAATAARGANQYAYLSNQKRIGAGQRVGAMTNEQKRGIGIRNDLTALAKERGEYATKTLGQKAAEARETKLKKEAFHLEKKSAAAGAAAESAKANQEYQEFLAEQRHKGAETGINAQEAATNKQEANTNRYEATHGGTTGGPSEAEKRGVREGKANALSTVHSFISSHGYPKSPAAKAELEREVAKESEVSPSDAAWAVNRYLKRHPAGIGADVNGPSLGR